jgi:hypothetical protein
MEEQKKKVCKDCPCYYEPDDEGKHVPSDNPKKWLCRLLPIWVDLSIMSPEKNFCISGRQIMNPPGVNVTVNTEEKGPLLGHW